MSEGAPLLDVSITVDYPGRPAVLRDLRVTMQAGESLALIGQSGSGKSTLALALLRLLDWKRAKVEGSIRFDGRELLTLTEKEMRRLRGREIALVLQSAAQALNPMLSLETQFRESWRAHSKEPWNQALVKIDRLLTEVDLPSAASGFLRRYPREVSIGQAQRVLIAMSLLHDPKLLLADEPTSALDVITQRDVLALLRRMTAERGMATLFISHDLLSVAAFASRVAILDHGRIVETAETEQIFRRPRHAYTQALIAALPANPFPPPPVQREEALSPLAALDQAVSERRGETIAASAPVPK